VGCHSLFALQFILNVLRGYRETKMNFVRVSPSLSLELASAKEKEIHEQSLFSFRGRPSDILICNHVLVNGNRERENWNMGLYMAEKSINWVSCL
jgi:hypothetical protein